jgi:tetratricopeptide (TPR) repeat protein
MAHVHIFISAVSREFAGYRDLLRGYLQRPNVTVHIQEDFIAGGLPTLDKLDRYIKECDAVIHLVGDMTGAMAQPASLEHIIDCYPEFPNKLPDLTPAFKGALDVSYTQWEAYLAIYHKKELLVAVPIPGAPREASTYVKSGEQEAAQQAHLKRLERYERFPVSFKDGENLALQLFKSTLYDLLISAGVQPFRQALDDINTEAERRHRELVESQHAIAAQIAREKGVDPKDLIAILQNLGYQEPNISAADIPQRLRERIDAMRTAAAQKPAPSNEGRDIEQVREDSRALLKDAKSAEALQVLNRQIEVEKAAFEDRKRRTVTLLADRAEVERLRYDYAAAKGTLDEVLRLDPDLFWRWIDLGNLWMTTGPLADALPAFRSAQAAAGRGGNAREQGVALHWVGDVQVAQGDLAGALKSYRDSFAIADRLAQSDPGNAGWRRDVAASHGRLAIAFKKSGETPKALDALRQGRDIMARLTTLSPTNAEWKRDLAWFEGQLAG